jgi:MYXO-CTERM domain-containing protein
LGEGDEWLDLATLEGVEGIFFTKGLTVVPEPALWGLAPLALALVVLRRRRQAAQG